MEEGAERCRTWKSHVENQVQHGPSVPCVGESSLSAAKRRGELAFRREIRTIKRNSIRLC